MARPPYHPTGQDRAKVRLMALNGVPQDDIADALGIAAKTLRKHFQPELASSTHLLNTQVAGKLLEKCLAGDTTAIIFWLKCKAGWNQKAAEEKTAHDGNTVLDYIKKRMESPDDPLE